MLIKSKKEEMIKELEGAISGSESLVFVNFHSLKVNDETALRRDLRNQGVSYKVSRKTLLARALKGKGYGEVPELGGEVAIAYLPADSAFVATSAKEAASTKAGFKPARNASSIAGAGGDATIAPREIYNFQKTHKGLLSILGGIFNGKFVDASYMMELATIPSKEALLAKLAFLMKSPMQRFAFALSEVAKKK